MSERISYADADGSPGAETVPVLDRIFGAALVLFGGVISLALGPIIIGIGSPGLGSFLHPFFSWRLWAPLIWLAIWLIPATIVGWIAGFPRVLVFFSYLWFTADPPNKQLSLWLWLGIFALSAVTNYAILPF